MSVSGGVAPYIYNWTPSVGTSDSVSGLTPGTYSVVVTDSNGNHVSGSVTISQPPQLIVTLDSLIVPPCFRTTGGSCGCFNTLWAIVSGGSAPYSYLWSPGGCTNDTLYGACYIEYAVTVTDSNHCTTSDSLLIVIPPPIIHYSGTASLNKNSAYSVFPNPACDIINIEVGAPSTENRTLQLFDPMGRLIATNEIAPTDKSLSIDLARFPKGVYLLKFLLGSEVTTKQFIKE